jgi:long-subunit fatty acid transport protein
LKVPQPWALSAGIRYGMRRNDLETQLHPRHHDSLATEHFDVELDAVWEINQMFDAITVTLPAGATFYEPALSGRAGLPPVNLLPHHWRDQVSVRLGGDWNAIRDRLAVRAGFAYESSGVNSAFTQLDFLNAERFQLHLGATLRVDDVDFTIAYIHIFQSTVDSTAPGLAQFPQNAASGTPALVNNAVYSADWNVFSVGVNAHFL